MRALLLHGAVRALPFVALGLSVACSSNDPSSTPKTCGGSGCMQPEARTDAGVSGEAGSSAPDAASCIPAGTDLPDDDFTDQNCDGIDGDAKNAIFVAPSGNDAAGGTRESPVKTLKNAISLATATGKDVYACNGTYEEAVLVSAPVRLYGGFDCEDGWTRTKERAVIAPGTGRPLTIQNVASAVVDRFELRAPDGGSPGESSIAAAVRGSQGVRFNRVVFDAGQGGNGASGQGAVAITTSAPAGADGAAVSVTKCSPTATGQCVAIASGGKSYATHTCGSVATRGGAGGHGGNVKSSTSPGDGLDGLGSAPGGKFPFAGLPGKPGKPGDPGQPGAQLGSIEGGDYVASNSGASGVPGEPGQAGGGGAGGGSAWGCGSFCHDVGSGGGQGGYGGCGGAAGGGGAGGGASIALLMSDSDVTISWCILRTAGGGTGGAPGAGAAGQAGGAAGQPGAHVNSSYRGQPGGAGGPGGEGGAGGPGGGGPSIGVLVAGSVPKTEAVTFDLGPGGAGGNGVAGQNGASGKNADVVQLTP